MEGAVEPLSETRAFLTEYSRAAVSAAVDKRFDLAFCGPRDDHRVGTNVINIMIADARDVLVATRPLPALRPHIPDFVVKKIGAGIAVGRKVGVPQKSGLSLGQGRRGRVLIGRQYIRNG